MFPPNRASASGGVSAFGEGGKVKTSNSLEMTHLFLELSMIERVYGPEMKVTERISSSEWAMVGSMARTSESQNIPAIPRLVYNPELKNHALAINARIRTEASTWAQQGWQGECGWAVFMRQRRHRCVLSGCTFGRPADDVEEDALWEALSAWSTSEPIP
jgi:hypothetical protein